MLQHHLLEIQSKFTHQLQIYLSLQRAADTYAVMVVVSVFHFSRGTLHVLLLFKKVSVGVNDYRLS